MKTRFILLCALMVSSLMMKAQEWSPDPANTVEQIYRSGNVGINTTNPLSKLSINGDGNALYSSYFFTNAALNGNRAIYALADRPTFGSAKVYAIQGSITSGTGYAHGVYGSSYNGTPNNSGRSYGMRALAGNATNTANYGLYAELRGQRSGTAVFGHDAVSNPSAATLLPTGISYAGYFIGKGHFSDNVGIGTTNPLSRLSVNGDGNALYSSYFHTNSTTSGNKAVYAVADEPTSGSGTVIAVQGSITSGTGYAHGMYGSSYNSTPHNSGRSYGVRAIAGNATNTANYGLYAELKGQRSGTAVFGHDVVNNPGASALLPSGISYGGYFIGKGYFSDKVGIGTKDPQNELDVCGTIRAKEVLVELGWCDYVFNDDYQLPTIEEEEEHINENGHLSGFESEATMAGEIQLADVTKRQQEKIEQMMLHLIAMDKEIKALKAQLNK